MFQTSGMDYIRSFDIRLEKDVYYAGETINGHVYLENVDNFKVKGDSSQLRKNFINFLPIFHILLCFFFDVVYLTGIRVVLRGKAHAEWKIMKSGERRTVKDDQYLLDDKTVIWGKGELYNTKCAIFCSQIFQTLNQTCLLFR